jgi:hypothetical protein
MSQNEPGVKKVLEYAMEARAKALHDLSTGTKEKFDQHQASYRAWCELIDVITVSKPMIGETE